MDKHDRMAMAEARAYARQRDRADARIIKRREKEIAREERAWFRLSLQERFDKALILNRDERNFWTTFYQEQVAMFAETFGPKYTPETWEDTDRANVGRADWTAVINAIRHIQAFLSQHSRDHQANER